METIADGKATVANTVHIQYGEDRPHIKWRTSPDAVFSYLGNTTQPSAAVTSITAEAKAL